MEMGPGVKYTMLKSGEKQVGGIVPLDADSGVPAHWIGYVTVADLDATLTLVRELGGSCPVPATEIPNIGRFAVIGDPQGAHICPFQSADSSEMPAPVLFDFIWEELMTTDPEAAVDFFGKLFGWKDEPWEMGDEGTYHIMKAGETGVAGSMKIPPGVEAPPHWISYVWVPDCDQFTEKAKTLGAAVFVEPRDIPDVGRFAVLGDPNGAVFALYKPIEK
jgi:predicted enzyme related to lactoylglutathione lyase